MTILRMTATFGGLENRTLTLTDGLNLLELPNEGGKSTWCAFIRAMFYGVETRKGRETSEKNRYTPWSGSPMAGTMDLLWQGKAITLRRFPKGSSPFGGFQAVYTGTEEPVPGLTADNAGQTLLGFGKEVFERTCFIGQGVMAFGPSAELEQRLAALASSGEEDVSYSATEATLRAWRNALQSNRANGSIPKTQAELAELQSTRRQMEELERTVADCDRDLERLAAEQEEAEADLVLHTAAQAEACRQRYEKAKANLAEAQAAWSALQDPPLSLPEPEPEDGGELNAFITRRWTISVALPLLAMGVALAAAGIGGLVPLFLALPLAAVLLLSGGGLFLFRRRELERQQKERDAVRLRREEGERQRQEDLRRAAKACLEAAELAWEAASQGGEPSPPAPSAPPKRSLEEDRARLAHAERALDDRRQQRSRALGNIQGLGDRTELEEQIAVLRQQLKAEEEQYAALTAAMDALAAAEARLQQRFSPAVSALAGEILAKLTAGRYDALTFTRSFEALAAVPGVPPKSAALLSRGTADQAYLALRLAICLLAFSGGERAPIILDDALVAFDDQRLSLALQVLRDFAVDRQVLLFTCQGREKTALAQRPLA